MNPYREQVVMEESEPEIVRNASWRSGNIEIRWTEGGEEVEIRAFGPNGLFTSETFGLEEGDDLIETLQTAFEEASE